MFAPDFTRTIWELGCPGKAAIVTPLAAALQPIITLVLAAVALSYETKPTPP